MRDKVKSQKSKVKNIIQKLIICRDMPLCLSVVKLLFSFGFAFFALHFTLNCFAKEITILYTGETHSMIYPCNCPIHPDGGVSRRAAVINKLRKTNPDILLLDCGGIFAGGKLDEYTQNAQLDMRRTQINLEAMEIMGYTAVNISDDEFNFGNDFLERIIDNTGLRFISSNIKMNKIPPYVVKNIQGVNIGIIGVSGMFAAQKASDYKFIEPKTAVKNIVDELKQVNVDIIIVLGYISKTEEELLTIPGIDVLITAYKQAKEEPVIKKDSTLIAHPYWQGKKLGKLSLILKDKKIINYKQEAISISKNIKDDQQVSSIVPACFSDRECLKKGMFGTCHNPSQQAAYCSYSQAKKVNLSVVVPKKCKTCKINMGMIAADLKRYFPKLVVSYIYYPDNKQALKIIDDFNIESLPVYLLGKDVEKEETFNSLKSVLEAKGGFYMIKPQYSGLAYFVKRQKIKNRLDVFISLYDKDTKGLLDLLKEFKPTVHFLAFEAAKGFNAAKGRQEIEEYKRCVCIEKYNPKLFWDYMNCRSKNIDSTWWDDCINDKVDITKIKTCAKGEEGIDLLKENIRLNKELGITYGAAYLLDNQEVFASQGVPSKTEFKKTLKE